MSLWSPEWYILYSLPTWWGTNDVKSSKKVEKRFEEWLTFFLQLSNYFIWLFWQGGCDYFLPVSGPAGGVNVDTSAGSDWLGPTRGVKCCHPSQWGSVEVSNLGQSRHLAVLIIFYSLVSDNLIWGQVNIQLVVCEPSRPPANPAPAWCPIWI